MVAVDLSYLIQLGTYSMWLVTATSRHRPIVSDRPVPHVPNP